MELYKSFNSIGLATEIMDLKNFSKLRPNFAALEEFEQQTKTNKELLKKEKDLFIEFFDCVYEIWINKYHSHELDLKRINDKVRFRKELNRVYRYPPEYHK